LCNLDRYLSMPLEDKHKLYACGTKFTTLDNVETWSQQESVGKTELSSGMLLLSCLIVYLFCSILHVGVL